MHYNRIILFFITFWLTLVTVVSCYSPTPAHADVVVQTATYAEQNCNWQGYTMGEKVNDVDLTWATGSGSSRKYIRAQRMADYFHSSIKASLYGLTECDSQMMADLAHLMGSQWKYIGGNNDTQNRTGWLYDSTKWHPGTLSVTVLPGDPDGGYDGRRLLQVGFYRSVSGTDPMLSVAMVHLSSGDPEARDLQMGATLDKIGGAVRLLAGDTNASSPAQPDPCGLTAARSQLACSGWSDPFTGRGGFQDYGRLTPSLAVDVMSVSPSAQSSGRIVINSTRTADAAASYSTDHDTLVSSVSFS